MSCPSTHKAWSGRWLWKKRGSILHANRIRDSTHGAVKQSLKKKNASRQNCLEAFSFSGTVCGSVSMVGIKSKRFIINDEGSSAFRLRCPQTFMIGHFLQGHFPHCFFTAPLSRVYLSILRCARFFGFLLRLRSRKTTTASTRATTISTIQSTILLSSPVRGVVIFPLASVTVSVPSL